MRYVLLFDVVKILCAKEMISFVDTISPQVKVGDEWI